MVGDPSRGETTVNDLPLSDMSSPRPNGRVCSRAPVNKAFVDDDVTPQ